MKDNGQGAVRGFLYAAPIAAMLWLLIFWAADQAFSVSDPAPVTLASHVDISR